MNIMAEAIGLASYGILVVTTLNTFATSFANAEKRINELFVSVALTSFILNSLGNTIREHEKEFKFLLIISLLRGICARRISSYY